MSEKAAIWEPLPWDTAFFGVKTARIVTPRIQQEALEQALAECRAWGAAVVHYLADGDHDLSVCFAEQASFHLVDVRVTLEWRPRSVEPPLPPDDLALRDYRDGDLPALQAIARNSYHHSRYYYDQHYARERCDALYAEWIARSCHGSAERVIVAERHGTAIGYLTCHFTPDERRGQLGLLGIEHATRGRGIGQLLMQMAQHWFCEHGARHVAVVTQGRNMDAQRLFQRCGFVTSQMQFWYHKWYE